MEIKVTVYYMLFAATTGRLEELNLHDATNPKHAEQLAKKFSKLPWLQMFKGYVVKERLSEINV